MKKDLSTWQIVLFLGVLLMAGVLALVDRPKPAPIEHVVITEQTCTASGGKWDACGSLCPPEQELCAEVCVEMCGCKTDQDCPFSYSCLEGTNKQLLCQRQKSVSE